MSEISNTLLISEQLLKTYVPVDENLYGNYTFSAVYNAQERFVREVLGEKLYYKLQELVYTGEITKGGNESYRSFLDEYVVPYECWVAAYEAISLAYLKVANLGVLKPTDANIQTVSAEEMNNLRDEYLNRAGIYRQKIVTFLRRYYDVIPELKESACCCCDGPELTISECPIFLGGPRNPNHKYIK